MKKNLKSLIIAIAVFIITLLSFFGVWYASHFSIMIGISNNSYNNLNFLTEGKVVVKNLFTGTSTSNIYNYEDIKHIVDYQHIPGFVPDMFNIYKNTFYSMII